MSRGSATARHYGTGHRKTRKTLAPKALGRICPLCDEPMLPGQPLHLDHSRRLVDDPGSTGDRMVHAACNLKRKRSPTTTEEP